MAHTKQEQCPTETPERVRVEPTETLPGLEEVILKTQKRKNFHRLIVKTNSSSLSEERMQILRQKIHDPNYIRFAIDKLAENISKALIEGYLEQKEK
ncbi:MAG: hypothetical protein HPY78_02645 [Brevinematales bacterium]|nr:hypothetical protein [Brevinematales bacterium]